jgi:hypothetical protein
MNAIKYMIRDREYFERSLSECSEQDRNEILSDMGDFWDADFILLGTPGKIPERYVLTDLNGNNISLNSLNGYQRGLVLNECYKHFETGEGDIHGTVEVLKGDYIPLN